MSIEHVRSAVRALRTQEIREVANFAGDTPGVLKFWFGESTLPTPEVIREAGAAAIMAGRTMYAPTLGIPELRSELGNYLATFDRRVDIERIAVTNSGVTALMLTMQMIVNPGDEVVVVTPVWPNMCEIPKILGAEVRCVSLRFGARGWFLDLQHLLESLHPGIKALIINSPNNPTGWTLTRSEQERILERCRRSGIWLISDDVYERLYFQGRCAPSFLNLADARDRFVSCNSFSKAWRMTGWRVGWAVLPEGVAPEFGKLIEYNSSCAPPFVQLAARTALIAADAEVDSLVALIRSNQRKLYALLETLDAIEAGAPARGGMYAFFRVKGLRSSLSLCKRLISEARLGLAPGSAFGSEAPDFLRWCLAVDGGQLEEGVGRFARFMAASPSQLLS